ncbi:uncharacterized protein SCODWIG_01694 [Saccharomycodes ludwigii]|uniref:TATA element modulatory factor 1 TATA binding domain-containing protein n=1 Tax=Saccharomycodes ludwigii TaxID=36035 RepID=A0A376B5I8_9ASCO|nr:uncharacterized protein SCODWIG_01694 [Saccharomycodes ludwigii]
MSRKLSVQERLELATKSGKKSKGKTNKNGIKSRESSVGIFETNQLKDTEKTQLVLNQTSEKRDNETSTTASENSQEQNQQLEDPARNEKQQSEIEEQPISNQTIKNVISDPVEVPIQLNKDFIGELGLSENYQKYTVDQLLMEIQSKAVKKLAALNNERSQDKELILQLKHEGEKLSKKELKLSDTIKLYKREKTKLEMKLEVCQEDLQSKIEEAERLHGEFYEIKDKNKLLQNKLNVMTKETAELSRKYDNLFEHDFKKLKDNADQLVQENHDLKLELNKVRNDYESDTKKSTLKFNNLSKSSEDEISRLETKLEQLRIRLENNNDDDISADQKIPKYVVSNESLDKVKSQYELLKQELKNTNKNWGSIENNLNNKIYSLQDELEALQRENKKLSEDLTLSKKLQENAFKDLETERTKNLNLSNKVTELNYAVDTLNHEISNYTQDYKTANEKIKLQKKQLEELLSTDSFLLENGRDSNQLQKKVHKIEEENSTDDKSFSTKLKELQQEWDIEPSVIHTTDVDMLSEAGTSNVTSGHDHLNNDTSDSRLEINFSFNESSRINITDDDFSKPPDFSRRLSSVSQQLPSSPSRKFQQSSIAQQNTQTISNAQLVSHLGSQVRRLETELETLHQSWRKLQREKSEANDEIIRQMNELDQLEKFREENVLLQNKMHTLESNQEKYIKLLDKKSRTIEELQNDVIDLKEMLQEQVQSLVELQERSR